MKCDEVTITTKAVRTKTVPTSFNEKHTDCKTKKFYILLVFLLITIVLLIAVGIYYYLIKYRAKQKPYYLTNDKLKEVLY